MLEELLTPLFEFLFEFIIELVFEIISEICPDWIKEIFSSWWNNKKHLIKKL